MINLIIQHKRKKTFLMKNKGSFHIIMCMFSYFNALSSSGDAVSVCNAMFRPWGPTIHLLKQPVQRALIKHFQIRGGCAEMEFVCLLILWNRAIKPPIISNVMEESIIAHYARFYINRNVNSDFCWFSLNPITRLHVLQVSQSLKEYSLYLVYWIYLLVCVVNWLALLLTTVSFIHYLHHIL